MATASRVARFGRDLRSAGDARGAINVGRHHSAALAGDGEGAALPMPAPVTTATLPLNRAIVSSWIALFFRGMPLGLPRRRRRVGAGALVIANVAFDDPNGGDWALAGREPHGGVQRLRDRRHAHFGHAVRFALAKGARQRQHALAAGCA
jgi:hypothetical protein